MFGYGGGGLLHIGENVGRGFFRKIFNISYCTMHEIMLFFRLLRRIMVICVPVKCKMYQAEVFSCTNVIQAEKQLVVEKKLAREPG
jgi:hypothetical protein